MPHGRTVGEESRWAQPFRKTVANRSRSADGFETNFINPKCPKKPRPLPPFPLHPIDAEVPLSLHRRETPKASAAQTARGRSKSGCEEGACERRSRRPRRAKKPTAAKKSVNILRAGPSDSDIQLRAYFIAERRMQTRTSRAIRPTIGWKRASVDRRGRHSSRTLKRLTLRASPIPVRARILSPSPEGD